MVMHENYAGGCVGEGLLFKVLVRQWNRSRKTSLTNKLMHFSGCLLHNADYDDVACRVRHTDLASSVCCVFGLFLLTHKVTHWQIYQTEVIVTKWLTLFNSCHMRYQWSQQIIYNTMLMLIILHLHFSGIMYLRILSIKSTSDDLHVVPIDVQCQCRRPGFDPDTDL